MLQNLPFNLKIAFQALVGNKLRSLLTALGIIFGVAAVIAMLSIGRGAKQEILEQMEMVGVNNIVVEAVVPEEEGEETESPVSGKVVKKYSPGLHLYDVEAIREVLPEVKQLSPEVIYECQILRKGRRMKGRLSGVGNSFFRINHFLLEDGDYFSPVHLKSGSQVCIIGSAVKKHFFGSQPAIGQQIKCGNLWLTVIGVLRQQGISEKAIENLGLRNYNMDIYTPIKTALLRVKDRSSISLDQGGRVFFLSDEEPPKKDPNYHQLDRLVIQMGSSDMLQPASDVINRLLKRRHHGILDYEITIPELLLQQQQQTKSIFNIVLGAIAGISLLVGGIGIMNIMLASVMERIKEIGIRRAVGAKEQDIISQFLMEAVLISLGGGVIGIMVGIGLAKGISYFTDILTIISAWSIILSFGIAFLVGLVFGLAPARKAAKQNPIESLRHE